MSETPASIGVVIVTHRSRQHLASCLPPVLASPLRPRVLVVNSSSEDGTVELAREMGAETLVVPRPEFNHGATRELARRHIGTDIVVMMTPDAHAVSSDFLEKLVQPLREGVASVSYARQIPRDGAGLFEAFPRHFNYPATSELRGREDVARLGSYTVFCSNACAAWVNRALDEVGGFPTVLSLEDTAAVSKLIAKGHRVAYVADAVVRHSHSYSLAQEFRRYFDTGYARHAMGRAALFGQSDERHGRKFASALLAQLMRERPAAIPYALCNIATKYLGYRLGRRGHLMPVALASACSGQDYYWSSVHLAANGRAESVAEPVSLQSESVRRL
jgi:rhamnosyltransferase